jgi:BirA family transcriptional regulator, biotin operon repressor / biotin---[acetyl-CoA-carboxylase] ligase
MALLPSELAEQCGVSLGQVEAALAGLRGAGFDIENKPGLGCRLVGVPDRIIADDLLWRLEECPVAREIVVFAETNSTNDVALRLGREGHPGALAVFAERQTAGRGRFGRQWDSADHAGLWFSLLLRPSWPMEQWPRLTTWAGVCVARAVERFVPMPARLKWPNDVLVDGRKVAGILIESALDAGGRFFAVAGIGLNVNQEEFSPELEGRAASLRQFAGARLDRSEIAGAVLAELGRDLETAGANFPAIVREAERRSALLGTWISLHTGAETIEGLAEALDENGQLLLRLQSGELRSLTAGEVTTRTMPVTRS